jgi:HlyD family secretion protein
MTSHRKIVLSIAALAGFGAVTAFSLRSAATDDVAQPAAVKPALTVVSATPEPTELPLEFSANGNVHAWQEASVGAEVNGLRLTEVRVNVGDTVRRGQTLAVFASETVHADLQQSRAGLAEAEAQALDAVANAGRARNLVATGALSEQQISEFLTAEQTATARVAAQRAAAELHAVRLSQTRVLAPDDGVISARTATVGAVVPAGQELFRMIRQSRLEWRAEVTANELAKLSPGAHVKVYAADGRRVEGVVRMAAPTVDPKTRMGLVYVDLPQTSGFRAGMFAKGAFHLGASSGLTVPQEAVVVRDGFSYVFVMNPDGRVAQRKVTTGRRAAGRIELLDIAPDALLVTRGAGFLNDGDLVRSAPAMVAEAPRETAPASFGDAKPKTLNL